MDTTEALVCPRLNGGFSMEKIKLTSVRPYEALVEIYATGVCSLDLSCIAGKFPVLFPCVLGHEGAGVVLETGDEVEHVRPNDKVILGFAFCENCSSCKDGHTAHCAHFVECNTGQLRPDGSVSLRTNEGRALRGGFFGQSSYARLAIVHRSSLVKVADDTDLKLYAPLGGIQAGVGTVMNKLDVQPGATIAVFGTGNIGISAIMAAKIRQAAKIIGIDSKPDRLQIAREMGATHTILSGEEDIVEKIREICPPHGVQFAVESSGVASVMEAMVSSLDVQGKAAAVGMPSPGTKLNIEALTAVILGREYVGCLMGDTNSSKMIPYLIEQHRQGNFPIHQLITYYPAEEYEKAFSDMKEGKTFKPVLVWKK